MNEQHILSTARSIPDAAARDEYLRLACAGDVQALERIRQHLSGSDRGPGLGESHSAEVGATQSIDSIGESPGERIGHYKLLQQLGEGGMGCVYMADQQEPVKRRVAIKVIKAGMDSKQVIARFEAERQALAMMDHPNIARVLDAGTTDAGYPFFVMELVKGIPITEYCDDHRLSLKDRLELFTSICNAVQHAHQKGVIHRDLKPANILVAEYDDNIVPKVIDFGLAKALNQTLTEKTMFTQLGQVVGTLEYMSPEQAKLNQLDVDTRSDIYSLGVILYELLTGTIPFDRERLRSTGFDQVLKIIREEEPPKPSTRLSTTESKPNIAALRSTEVHKLNLLLRGELDWIVMKSMAKERDRRYESANGLAMDVRRYLTGDAVLAAPPSIPYRLRKFASRHRTGFTVGMTLAIALLIGFAGTTWGMIWALQERARVTGQSETAAAAIRDANAIVISTLNELETDNDVQIAADVPIGDFAELQGMDVDALGMASKNLAVYLSRSLKDEAHTRQVAEQAAFELEQVARFQADLLSGIDIHLMGAHIRAELLERFAASARRAGMENEQIDLQTAELDSLIARADPTGLARSTLDKVLFRSALETIEIKFVDQPLVKARLLQSIATTARDLGLFELAEGPQTEALEIRRQRLGDEHADTLASIFHQGRLLYEQARLDEAEVYLDEAMTVGRETLGDDHPDTLRAINWMGNLLTHQGRPEEAETYLREALEGRRLVLGEQHADTLESLNDLAISLKLQTRIDEAADHYLRALDGFREVLGNDHPWTLVTLYNLGRLFRDEGELDRAETYHAEARRRRRRVLGDQHPDTLRSVRAMGTVLVDRGELEQAEPYFRETLATRRRLLGTDHPDTLNTIEWLAYIHREREQYAEAEALYRESWEIQRRLDGDRSAGTLTALNLVGRILEYQNRFEDAETVYREVIEGRGLGDEEATADSLETLVRLAHVLSRQGRFSEAVSIYREGLAGQRRLLGDDASPTLATMWGLANALCELQRHGEAEELVRECYDGRRSLLGEDEWLTLNAASLLGASIAGQGRFSEAEPLLIEGYQNMEALDASAAYYRAEALERIIDFYARWHAADPESGYDAKAEEWRLRRSSAGN